MISVPENFMAYMLITLFDGVLLFAYYISIPHVLFPLPYFCIKWNCVGERHTSTFSSREILYYFDLDLTTNFGFYSGYIYDVYAPSVQLLCIFLCFFFLLAGALSLFWLSSSFCSSLFLMVGINIFVMKGNETLTTLFSSKQLFAKYWNI